LGIAEHGLDGGDERDRVIENRRRAFSAVGLEPESMFDAWLVHGAEVLFAESPRPLDRVPSKADAVLTNRQGVTLFLRFADCVPILLFDPKRQVVGLVHAGWLGTVRGAALAAIAAMQSRYQCSPADILAGIGPSIGPDHYEIGVDVAAQIRVGFGGAAESLISAREGRTYLDLWAANRLQLESAGVREIEVSGLCTACSLDDWFSHRAERGRTGRFGALIALAA
jgi:YfiH family protein